MARTPIVAEDCLFCTVTLLPDSALPWHDKSLTRLPGVGAVIAGLGALVPGYVLVFPEQHIESTLRIPSSSTTAFAALLQEVVSAVTEHFGEVTIFEHGACQIRQHRQSACLDHAHVHVLPGTYSLARHLEHPTPVAELKPEEHHQYRHTGYLFLHEPDMPALLGRDLRVSQYFRRQIATSLGATDQWDYLMYPFYENVRKTITHVEGALRKRVKNQRAFSSQER